MDKTNFVCPACKEHIVVGKRLKSHYTCNQCNSQMLITREERRSGELKYEKSKQYHYYSKKEGK